MVYEARNAELQQHQLQIFIAFNKFLLVLHRYAYFHFYRYRCFTHSCSRYADIYRYSLSGEKEQKSSKVYVRV